MICARCGGEVLVNENCDKCGIEYSEMIEGIRHDELLKLIEKIEDMLSNHQSIEIEESLLACELANSHFLVPAEARDNGIVVGASKTPDGKKFILIYTDKEEYDKASFSIDARANPFNEVLGLLTKDYDGFVINSSSCACVITRDYLKDYFGDDMDA